MLPVFKPMDLPSEMQESIRSSLEGEAHGQPAVEIGTVPVGRVSLGTSLEAPVFHFVLRITAQRKNIGQGWCDRQVFHRGNRQAHTQHAIMKIAVFITGWLIIRTNLGIISGILTLQVTCCCGKLQAHLVAQGKGVGCPQQEIPLMVVAYFLVHRQGWR